MKESGVSATASCGFRAQKIILEEDGFCLGDNQLWESALSLLLLAAVFLCLLLPPVSMAFSGEQNLEKPSGSVAESNKMDTKEEGGDCLKIDDLDLRGNTAFSSLRLKMRMKTWHSSLLPGRLGCLNEKWLEKDMLSLTDLYRQKGFPDVKISRELQRIGKNRVRIVLSVEEGLRYALSFEGNGFFSDRTLKKKIDLTKKGNLNDSALRRGIKAIKDAYLDAGFADVSLDYDKTVRDDDATDRGDETGFWTVLVTIKEGKQRLVSTLTIRGNETVEEKDIQDAMILRQKGLLEKGGFNARTLEKDIQAVKLLYLSRGFLNVGVTESLTTRTIVENEIEQDLVDIDIAIEEGVRTRVNTARVKGLGDTMTEADALKEISLTPGSPFREYMVRSDENALSIMISEMGYPHVKVKGRVHINAEKTLADLEWDVEKGPFTRFGEIRYSGNNRLKKSIIEKRVNIKSGEPFSLKKVFDAEKSIRSIKAVKYVRINSPELKAGKKEPGLDVVIQENKPYFVEAAAGYDTEKELYFTSKVGDNNFLGREIDAWVEGSVSGIGFRTEAGLSKPFFLDTDIDAFCNIYYEDEEELNQDFGTKSWGISSGFSKPFFDHVKAGLNFKYENRTMYGGDDEELEDARNILVTTFMLGYDTRDSAMRPKKGFLSSGSLDLYTGFDNDLDRFLKYRLDIRKYVSPFEKITFALRTKFGYIQPFGSGNTVAEDQLFFLGGTPDVRGFRENMLDFDEDDEPRGGRTSINSSLEARIDLPANFELNCFFDTGRIDDLDSDASSKGFRSSVGAGIRYITPIGPVGLLYGHNLDAEAGESSGRIHFSVGYTF